MPEKVDQEKEDHIKNTNKWGQRNGVQSKLSLCGPCMGYSEQI